MIICKRPSPLDDHLQETGPCRNNNNKKSHLPSPVTRVTGQKEEKKQRKNEEKEEK